MKQTRLLSEFSCLSKYTRLYPILRGWVWKVLIFSQTLCLIDSFSLFAINFSNKFFQQEHQCQTVWVQIRPDNLSTQTIETLMLFLQKLSAGYGHNPPPDKTPPAHFCIRGQNPPHEFYN